MLFHEQIKQDAASKVGQFWDVAVRLAPQTGQITARSAVVAFYREGVRLALEMLMLLKDYAMRMPEVGAVYILLHFVTWCRKHRSNKSLPIRRSYFRNQPFTRRQSVQPNTPTHSDQP